MSTKTSDEKIAAIRTMRKNGFSQGFICNALHTTSFVVSTSCKDIKMDLRFKKPSIDPLKNENPCKKYNFCDLSLEDQKRYLEYKKPNKNESKKVFIFGNKNADFEEVLL